MADTEYKQKSIDKKILIYADNRYIIRVSSTYNFHAFGVIYETSFFMKVVEIHG